MWDYHPVHNVRTIVSFASTEGKDAVLTKKIKEFSLTPSLTQREQTGHPVARPILGLPMAGSNRSLGFWLSKTLSFFDYKEKEVVERRFPQVLGMWSFFKVWIAVQTGRPTLHQTPGELGLISLNLQHSISLSSPLLEKKEVTMIKHNAIIAVSYSADL